VLAHVGYDRGVERSRPSSLDIRDSEDCKSSGCSAKNITFRTRTRNSALECLVS